MTDENQEKLDALRKELDGLKTKGFEKEIGAIREKFSDPSKAGEIEKDIKILKQKFRESLFEIQITKEFDKAVIKQKSKPEIAVPENVLMVDEIFVIYKGGILLSHQTRRLKPFSDNEIVAGMLTAVLNYVQDFVRDTFQQKSEPIKRIEYGTYKILIETGAHVCVAAVLGGDEPPTTTTLMREMIGKIEERYKSFFENWDGDIHKIREIDGFVGELVRSISGEAAPASMPRIEPGQTRVQPSPMPLSPAPEMRKMDDRRPAEAPKPEPAEESVELKKSFCYLVKEERPNRGYVYFNQALKRGVKGLCVSRDPPQKVKPKFNLPEDTPVIWLSNTPSEQSYQPKNLEKIAFSLIEFMSKDEGVLILIDCIEYLITNNSFTSVLKLVQSLKDRVAVNKAVLLITTNPAALESQQISMMEREMDIVI